MISLTEVAERAQKGPKLDEKEWNMGMFWKMQELADKHKLKIGEVGAFYEVDDEYADQLFDAALEYLSKMGVYCISTNRAIRFTEEEVKEACREAPDKITVGRDRDVRTIIQRRIEDTRPPNISAGGHGPWSEELMPLENMIKELVKPPRVDFLETFNYHRIMGREIHGTPMVVYASRKATERARTGVSLAGRPGLALCYYPILTTAEAFIAAKDEERGLRSSDGLMLSMLPDLKVETGMLAASMYYEEYGCFRQNGGAGGSVGGFAGDYEGAMIEAVVKNIAAWMVYRDNLQYQLGIGRRTGRPNKPTLVPTKPTVLPTRVRVRNEMDSKKRTWCSFAAEKALSRHKNTITSTEVGTRSASQENPGTVESLLSTAIPTIKGTVMGPNLRCLWTPPPTTVRWVIEVSDATLKSRIKLTDLDELFGRIQREKLQSHKSGGDRRQLMYSDPQVFFNSHKACYDYIKQRPTDHFLQNRRKAIQYLENLGLEFA
jgi:methylamine--corrinoid protein Co-methyltransferase